MEISYTREAVRELTRARAIERKKKNSRLRESRPSGASKKHREAADQRRKPSNPASTKKRHPPVAAITAKQERHRAVKLKRPSLKANVPTDCNLDYLRAGYVGKPQVGETSVYASVTTGDVPIPLKTDHAHRVRIIWFNDLNDEYTFNRQFTQGMKPPPLFAHVFFHTAQTPTLPVIFNLLRQAAFLRASDRPGLFLRCLEVPQYALSTALCLCLFSPPSANSYYSMYTTSGGYWSKWQIY
jgi:hypothetical protein